MSPLIVCSRENCSRAAGRDALCGPHRRAEKQRREAEAVIAACCGSQERTTARRRICLGTTNCDRCGRQRGPRERVHFADGRLVCRDKRRCLAIWLSQREHRSEPHDLVEQIAPQEATDHITIASPGRAPLLNPASSQQGGLALATVVTLNDGGIAFETGRIIGREEGARQALSVDDYKLREMILDLSRQAQELSSLLALRLAVKGNEYADSILFALTQLANIAAPLPAHSPGHFGLPDLLVAIERHLLKEDGIKQQRYRVREDWLEVLDLRAKAITVS